MKKEIPSGAAMAVVGAILVVIIAAFVWSTSRGPEVETVSNAPKELLEDPDPIKRGQPGYRERIGDAPAPGDPATAIPGRPD